MTKNLNRVQFFPLSKWVYKIRNSVDILKSKHRFVKNHVKIVVDIKCIFFGPQSMRLSLTLFRCLFRKSMSACRNLYRITKLLKPLMSYLREFFHYFELFPFETCFCEREKIRQNPLNKVRNVFSQNMTLWV